MASVPKKITCKDQVFAIDFHPNRPYIAAGLIDGSIELWEHDAEANRLVHDLQHHALSCRGLQFTPSGDKLVTISSDKSWKVANESGVVVLQAPDAHASAINRMLVIDQDTLVTGDDDGIVKVWDMRGASLCTASWDVHKDFVSGLLYHSDSHTLFSSSGDATIGVYDIRRPKDFYLSDDQESEINCLEMVRHGRKLVCGTQEGILLFFNSGSWGDCSDRYPGHLESIDCFHKIDETTLLTGSADGIVRVLGIQPNKIHGIVADQSEPIEAIKSSNDKMFIGTLGLDESIRFWDISILHDESGDEDGEDVSSDEEEGGVEGSGGEDEETEEVDGPVVEEEDASASSDEDEDSDSEGSDKDKDEDSSKDDDSSASSSSDESDKHVNKRKKIPTAREKFYADL